MCSVSADPRRLVVNLRDERPVWSLPDWALEEIRAAVPPGWEVVVVDAAADARGDGGEPSAEAIAAVAGAEVYLGHGFPRSLFAAAHRGGSHRLRWVHSAAAGVGASLYPEMRESGIVLTNSARVYAAPIAETVMAMILFFARGLDLAVRAQNARRWGKDELEGADSPVREIGGSTVGILGFGGIGSEVARRALAMDARVLATRRRPAEAPPGVDLLIGDGALPEVLRRSDFVVLALPDTERTRGLVGAAELDLMRPGAVLVNVGRGSVLDEHALASRLASGRLRGAALDVFSREPLPADSPLWDLPGLLITPHVSGISRTFWRRQIDLVLENIDRYLRGRPLLNTVDKQAGY
jgi:phosphoglycerate dehydrogenase-like enzyme